MKKMNSTRPTVALKYQVHHICIYVPIERYEEAYLLLRHVLILNQMDVFLVRKLRIPRGKEPSRHAADLAVLLKPRND